MSDIIFAVITALISIALFIYVSFTARGKGPILSNTYLFAVQKEREKIDKKAEYHMVSVVFGIFGSNLCISDSIYYYRLENVPLYSVHFVRLCYSICYQRSCKIRKKQIIAL